MKGYTYEKQDIFGEASVFFQKYLVYITEQLQQKGKFRCQYIRDDGIANLRCGVEPDEGC